MNLKQSVRTMLPLVAKKAKHVNYEHVVRLSREYYRPLITGEGADHLIKRFNLREDEEAHKQRLRLTQLITPSITNTLMAPARKVPKVRPVVNSIEWEEGEVSAEEVKKRQEDIEHASSVFYAGKGIDHYMGSVLLDQGAIDPNAFCLVLFDDYDARWEKPRAYPQVIGCEDAWNFSYLNGRLDWLLVHRDYEYEATTAAKSVEKGGRIVTKELKAPKKTKGHAWWMYTDTHQIMMLQVDKGRISASVDGIVVTSAGEAAGETPTMAARATYWYRASKDELYEVVFYEHNSGAVQAFRLGFMPDMRTKGATMVNLWDPAMPYLLKGVKSGSELDISASLHAFLQKISYENPCRGYTDDMGAHSECNNGYGPTGIKCKSCGGSGMEVHRSGQDHITLAMPRSKDEAFDLSSITHYVQLPIEVLDWQDKYVDKLERNCYRSVYNSDRFRPADASTTTATGDIIDLQSIYDTLKPCADWYSQSRVLILELIARYTLGDASAQNINVAHEFPRNMRFETTAERVKLLQDMRNAGASNGAMMQVDGMILDDLYVDDPQALRKARTIGSFNPFVGKAEATVLSLISQDLATKEDKVLWTNENRVYDECEQRAMEKGVDFYEIARAEQRAMIDEVVAEIVDELDAQAEAMAPRVTLGVGDPSADPQPGEGDPGRNAPPSPGNSATQ